MPLTPKQEKFCQCEWYVYHLIDPRCGAVFYVGKGKGKRMYQHEADARNGRVSNLAKTERINSILKDGKCVEYFVVGRFNDESEAYAVEKEQIFAFDDLTNIALGGGSVRLSYMENSLMKAKRLLAKVKPFMVWFDEKYRSNYEISLYNVILNDIHETIRLCESKVKHNAA